MELRRWFVGPLGLLVFVAGCETIVGIEEGRLRTFCSAKPEGTPLPEQVTGDCLDWVCDGQGNPKQNPAPLDNDDGNPCTIITCNGVTPVITMQTQAPCYSGPTGTENVGICKGGIQQCDAGGKLVGGCTGEAVPNERDICENGEDDDCNGEADKPCICGDGILQPEIGEECDDGGTVDGDPCSPTCKEQRVLAIAPGGYHTCAILSGGTVKCWGDNTYGELGLGDTIDRGRYPNQMGGKLLPVDLGSGRTAKAIATGSDHSCAILDDDTVKCWGANGNGQLGLGDTQSRGDAPGEMGDALPIVDLGSQSKPMGIAAGGDHTCVMLADGSVKCWGSNATGELGLGDTMNRGDNAGEMGIALSPIDLGNSQLAEAIVAGETHTCALLKDGNVKCWGGNEVGQLGLGDTVNHGDNPLEMGDNLPWVQLGTGAVATAISTSYVHTCVHLSDDTAKCWGSNGYGELGLGDPNTRGDQATDMGDALQAVDIGENATIMQISTGRHSSCVLLRDGDVKCWGWAHLLGLGDAMQNRGDGPSEMGNELPAVLVGAPVAALASGSYRTCALLASGSIKCWGANGDGQLGLGDTDPRGDGPNEMGDKLPTVKLFSNEW